MLVKRAKTVKGRYRIFLLSRVKDSEYPSACIACYLRYRKCKFSDFDCVDYDTKEYSFVVRKKLKIYG
jgi:hypothetical protein